MKKVLVAFSLVVTLGVVFPVSAIAGNPPPNVGRQNVPPLTQGATADSVHASQAYCDSIGMPVGLHFVEYFNEHGLIPGHVEGFPFK